MWSAEESSQNGTVDPKRSRCLLSMPSTSCPIRLAPETHDMENAALPLSGPSLAWREFQNIQITQVVETTYGSMEADTEVCALLFRPRDFSNLQVILSHRHLRCFRLNPENYIPARTKGRGSLSAYPQIRFCQRTSTSVDTFRTWVSRLIWYQTSVNARTKGLMSLLLLHHVFQLS